MTQYHKKRHKNKYLILIQEENTISLPHLLTLSRIRRNGKDNKCIEKNVNKTVHIPFWIYP